MARAVVTGATGFIGSHLCAHLRGLGWQTIAIARRGAQTAALETIGVEIARADILDRTGVLAAVPTETDVLFHLACAPFGTGLEANYVRRVNEDGLRNALFAATDKKITCTVYVSDAVCFGKRTDILTERTPLAAPQMLQGSYAKSKRECEAIFGRAVARGLEAVSLMPGAVLGDGLRRYRALPFLAALGEDEFLQKSGGRHFVDVETFVQTLVTAAQRGRTGQRYLVGSHYYSWQEIAQDFLDVNNLSTKLQRRGGIESILRGIASMTRRSLFSNPVDDDAWAWASEQHISADVAVADLGFTPENIQPALTALYKSLRSDI
jgi:dihydroflavonol-4-reductase